MKHVKLFEAFSTHKPLTKRQINWLDKCTTGNWSLNPSTGLVDVDGDFDCISQRLKDFKGVAFGHVKGDFSCNDNLLTSLAGAPQTVDGDFCCSSNQLTSLVDGPQTVGGYFGCSFNQLTSLKGAPQTVGESFNCSSNQLTSLVDAPQTVGGNFDCGNNQLTSLDGAPKTVNGYFSCSNNRLTSLVGFPQTVKGDFYCRYNHLTSLERAPQTVGGVFYCDSNQLTSLEGAPKTVGGDFNCADNPLKSLEGAPERVGSFNISVWDSAPVIRTLDWKEGWDKGDKEFTKTLTSKLKKINALGSGADKGKPISMLLSLAEPNLLDYLISQNLSTSDKFAIYGAIKANIPDVWNKLKDELDPEGATSDLLDLGF